MVEEVVRPSAAGADTASKSSVVLDVQNTSGLLVSLHPLPILNISEHLTRTRLQLGKNDVRVVGALIGTQTGRDVEILNTFELRLDEQTSGEAMEDGRENSSSSGVRIDHAFLASRQAQFKQVFPTFDFLGWYSVGQAPSPDDVEIHKQFLEYNESPLFLQLFPQPPPSSKDLPLSIYESAVEVMDNVAQTFFVKAPYKVETGEAERIAVDHTAKAVGEGAGEESSLVANLMTQRNAIKMLADRIKLIVDHLAGVLKGTAKSDHEVLRQTASLIASLPASNTPEFKEEYLTEYNDVLLTAYLSEMTNGLQSLNELVDKFDLVHARSTRGGRVGRTGAALRAAYPWA